jgi:hypothetical protein
MLSGWMRACTRCKWHRRDRLGRDALLVATGIDNVADSHPLMAHVAVMIIDRPEAVVGLGIGYSPKPIVGRCAIYEPTHGALGLNLLRVHRIVPEAHRRRVGEASAHSFCVLFTELAQAKTTRREYRGGVDFFAMSAAHKCVK